MPQEKNTASSTRGQYSVPAEQQLGNYSSEGTFFPTSEGNMDVYTNSQNSLVLSGTGRPIYSSPGSPITTVSDALRVEKRNTSYCDAQLPLPISADGTLVIPDGSHSAYSTAFSNSNVPMTLVMSQEAGPHGDDLPNQACNTHNANKERLNAKMLLNQHSFPADPLDGSSTYFRDCPSEGLSAESVSNDIILGQYCTTNGDVASSMVTGVGFAGEGGGTITDENLQKSLLNQGMVYEDFGEDIESLLRKLDCEEPQGGVDSILPDMSLLKFIDMSYSGSGSDASLPNPYAQTPVDADFINGFSDVSIQPVQVQTQNQVPVQTPVQNVESVQEQSAIEDDLDMIKLMKPQPKPKVPASLGLQGPNHLVPTAPIPSPLKLDTNVPPSPSPTTPYTPHPPTPYGTQPYTPNAPIQVSAPSPAPPSTPQTPATPRSSQRGPFNLNTYINNDERVLEVGAREDLALNERCMALQALLFSEQLARSFEKCLTVPCDLKVAIDARANLCGFNCDQDAGKLLFAMPRECVQLDKWLRVNQGKIDLRDRQLILQQITNLLAALHTIGNQDRLSLWGSFVVWVAPDMRVHLLIDFPEMLAKMEKCAGDMSFDPRIEDIKAIFQLYKKIFQPFVNQDSSWVSPGVKQLLKSFEKLVMDPSSVYRMAELARTLGERRLCKLEVELMTLPQYVYCIEHELLESVLSHITSMVPPDISDMWGVQWAETRQPVTSNVMASAHRPMRLVVCPVPSTGFGINPFADQRLIFRSSYFNGHF